LIAHVVGRPYEQIQGFVSELEKDADLRAHIRGATQHSADNWRADINPLYGRRIGWYAIARSIRPRIVVETGVDKGLGSCVLTAALARNSEEGYPGYYYGTDIDPNAGYLLAGKYKQYGEVLYGDSVQSLRKLEETVDLFVNDSDHSADYETSEYEVIRSKLSEQAVILGDNSHYTDRLLSFALETKRQFLFFHEQPFHHWYPGAGIGIAFKRV
jgi:hypothetical protein